MWYYIILGYQWVLTYSHNDQSYSYFGRTWPDAVGSMGLTEFMVKCFGLTQSYV